MQAKSLRCGACTFLCAYSLVWAGEAPVARATAPAVTSQPAIHQPTTVPETDAGTKKPEWISVHFQGTTITQGHTHFRSPYEGPNSVRSVNELRTSYVTTLSLGTRLWPGAEAYIDPEMAGGRGIGSGFGIADFPNGQIQRVGNPEPRFYVARGFFRQTIGLGGGKEWIEAEDNQVAGWRDISRVTFTVGKFAAVDMFDKNDYANDASTQFMNWGFINNTSWDYPADARGYTWGFVAELNQPGWALRYGVMTEPSVDNGEHFDWHLDSARGQVAELEIRHTLFGQPGKVRYLAYLNRAHMGNYDDTLETPAFQEDITLSRRYSLKYGFALNLEQQITDDLGIFARLGWSDGRNESWAYTEVDATASIGLSLSGDRWGRPDDAVGVAALISGLSGDHRDYLKAGGVGMMLGDGALSYGPEEVIELYYSAKLFKGFFLSADFQFIDHPGFNAARGPLWLGAVRVHYEF